MAEFSLINQFCKQIGASHSHTKLSVGDDAAIVAVPPGMQLAISVDTMVAGVHFYPDVDPAKLAYKLLAINLSDMAAMGAVPKWATLALTLASINKSWLRAFSASLHTSAERFGVQLIGGDTTQGPLTLSMQIMGLLPAGQALTRAGAKPGDDVYVTGDLGDAALALAEIKYPGTIGLTDANDLQLLKQKLEMPVPQCAIGQSILGKATACIDISDGLLADLGHIAVASGVSIEVQVDKIPLSPQYLDYLRVGGSYDLALTGGDDYQLAFALAPEHRYLIPQLRASNSVVVTRIGRVQAATVHAVSAIKNDQQYIPKQSSGYQHFN